MTAVLKTPAHIWALNMSNIESTFIGDRLGTVGAAGMGSDTDAAKRQIDSAYPDPPWCRSQVEPL